MYDCKPPFRIGALACGSRQSSILISLPLFSDALRSLGTDLASGIAVSASAVQQHVGLAKAEVNDHKTKQDTKVPKPYYHVQGCPFAHQHDSCQINHQHFQRCLYFHPLQSGGTLKEVR